MNKFIVSFMFFIFMLTACKSMKLEKTNKKLEKQNNSKNMQEDIQVKEELTIAKPKDIHDEKKEKIKNKPKSVDKDQKNIEKSKKDILMECKTNADCKSNICLAFEKDKYRCSKKCFTDKDCINTKLPICDDWIKKCRIENK